MKIILKIHAETEIISVDQNEKYFNGYLTITYYDDGINKILSKRSKITPETTHNTNANDLLLSILDDENTQPEEITHEKMVEWYNDLLKYPLFYRTQQTDFFHL
jgi:hypothetical protein